MCDPTIVLSCLKLVLRKRGEKAVVDKESNQTKTEHYLNKQMVQVEFHPNITIAIVQGVMIQYHHLVLDDFTHDFNKLSANQKIKTCKHSIILL